jgi:hypothetical protein
MDRPNWVRASEVPLEGRIPLCCLAIPEKALTIDKQQLHQPPGGIVDEHQQDALRNTSFEPVVFRAIDLDQFPETSSPLPHLVRHHLASFLRLPQPFRNHQLPYTLITEL